MKRKTVRLSDRKGEVHKSVSFGKMTRQDFTEILYSRPEEFEGVAYTWFTHWTQRIARDLCGYNSASKRQNGMRSGHFL